ncbi:SGNH hydrolase-type esterase domain-containing protein [Phlyctochytrium arcticum]|nr:SGNH hydrolase-type esterase domain-containing protein [Phlyctochytrium arcticum]
MHPLQLDQILLFGDSISQFSWSPEFEGWGAYLASQYVRRLDVVNRGFSGYNTEQCRELILPILQSVSPPHAQIRLVTVFLGANDATLPFWTQQHVTLASYKANLQKIVEAIQSFSKDTQVLLITPPPVHLASWRIECEARSMKMNRSVESAKIYRDACIEVADQLRVSLLDTWDLYFRGSEGRYNEQRAAEVLHDGVHLNTIGNRLLGKAIMEKIRKEWPNLMPEALPNIVPLWTDLAGRSLTDII